MDIALIVIVLAVGLTLLTLEIVALPGGIAGGIGILMLAFGIWWTYNKYGNTAGTCVLVGCVILTIVFLAFLLKSKTWKRFSLNEESDSKVNQVDTVAIQVGAKGKTVARLAPTGKALIDGQMVEVHAINKFIDPDRSVEVVAVEGYRIDVKEIDDQRF